MGQAWNPPTAHSPLWCSLYFLSILSLSHIHIHNFPLSLFLSLSGEKKVRLRSKECRNVREKVKLSGKESRIVWERKAD